jgi:hypothetical protein
VHNIVPACTGELPIELIIKALAAVMRSRSQDAGLAGTF